ncbi:hypothetical protein LXL04_024760 [Taraxacum kok-saghyz]
MRLPLALNNRRDRFFSRNLDRITNETSIFHSAAIARIVARIAASLTVWYQWWELVFAVVALLSTLITSVQFAFFEVSPTKLTYLEGVEVFMLLDTCLHSMLMYINLREKRWRYILRYCLPRCFMSLPWVFFYHITGRKIFRWILLLRMLRLEKVHRLFSMTEDSRVGFISTRYLKTLVVKLIAFHLGACIFFFSAITIPVGQEGKTWLGSLTLGEISYSNFRHVGFLRLYIICLYFSAITITTIGTMSLPLANNRRDRFVSPNLGRITYGTSIPHSAVIARTAASLAVWYQQWWEPVCAVVALLSTLITALQFSFFEVHTLLYSAQMLYVSPLGFLLLLTEDSRVGFISTRYLKTLVVKLIAFHLGACIFFFSAITIPVGQEGKTWLGSLTLGEISYSNFRHVGFLRLYIICLYFSAITITTIGYGDIHPVTSFDMIIAIVIASSLHLLDAYVNTFTKQSNESRKPLEILPTTSESDQMRDQVTREEPLAIRPREEPLAIRIQKFRALYEPYIKDVLLFGGCTVPFINEIASRVHIEHFDQGDLVVERGYILDHIYFVYSGELEMLRDADSDGPEITPFLTQSSSIGDISVLCEVPQPFDVRAVLPSTLLRLDKLEFKHILAKYVSDDTKVLENLSKNMKSGALKGKKSQQELAKDEVERAMKVNLLVYLEDEAIREESDVNLKDYHGKTALGSHYHILHIDYDDGNTPLYLALTEKHDEVIELLIGKGATLMIEDEEDIGEFMCVAAATDNVAYVERLLLKCGLDVNSQDKDGRTALHVASRRASDDMMKLLIKYGAYELEDRWGILPSKELSLHEDVEALELMHANGVHIRIILYLIFLENQNVYHREPFGFDLEDKGKSRSCHFAPLLSLRTERKKKRTTCGREFHHLFQFLNRMRSCQVSL